MIALLALTGDTVWYIPLPNTPVHIDCTILGNKRCLILGEKGFLIAIDYISGMRSWTMMSQNISIWPQPEDIDFPTAVPTRGELITLSRFKPEQHRLLFISMDTGLIISEPLVDRKCFDVRNLSYSSEGDLHYTCIGRNRELWTMIYKLSDSKGKGNIGAEPIDYTKRLSSEEGGLEEHEVTFTNRGICPNNCQVSVAVTDSSNRTVWSYSADRTHVMSPLPLRFRPHITGFLIKLWQWQDQPLVSSSSIKVEHIKERIVLITFNKSGLMHVVNASQTDITQLCYLNNSECQPQLSFQTQSALLVDVNADGSQDLISYFVTYHSLGENYHKPDKIKDWELQSKVRVVRLEAELPKLYDAVSKH